MNLTAHGFYLEAMRIPYMSSLLLFLSLESRGVPAFHDDVRPFSDSWTVTRRSTNLRVLTSLSCEAPMALRGGGSVTRPRQSGDGLKSPHLRRHFVSKGFTVADIRGDEEVRAQVTFSSPYRRRLQHDTPYFRLEYGAGR